MTSATFASSDSAPKLMSDTNSGMSRCKRLGSVRADDHARRDLDVVELGPRVELRGDELDRVPLGKLGARDAHRAGGTMRAGFDSPFFARDWITPTSVSSGLPCTSAYRRGRRTRSYGCGLSNSHASSSSRSTNRPSPSTHEVKRCSASSLLYEETPESSPIVPPVHPADAGRRPTRVRRRAARRDGGTARRAPSGPSRDRPASPVRGSSGPRRDQRSRRAPPAGCREGVRTRWRCDAVARSGAFRLVHTRPTRGKIEVLDVEKQRRRRLLTPASQCRSGRRPSRGGRSAWPTSDPAGRAADNRRLPPHTPGSGRAPSPRCR